MYSITGIIFNLNLSFIFILLVSIFEKCDQNIVISSNSSSNFRPLYNKSCNLFEDSIDFSHCPTKNVTSTKTHNGMHFSINTSFIAEHKIHLLKPVEDISEEKAYLSIDYFIVYDIPLGIYFDSYELERLKFPIDFAEKINFHVHQFTADPELLIIDINSTTNHNHNRFLGIELLNFKPRRYSKPFETFNSTFDFSIPFHARYQTAGHRMKMQMQLHFPRVFSRVVRVMKINNTRKERENGSRRCEVKIFSEISHLGHETIGHTKSSVDIHFNGRTHEVKAKEGYSSCNSNSTDTSRFLLLEFPIGRLVDLCTVMPLTVLVIILTTCFISSQIALSIP